MNLEKALEEMKMTESALKLTEQYLNENRDYLHPERLKPFMTWLFLRLFRIMNELLEDEE